MKKDKKRKISFNSLKKLYKYIHPYKTSFYIGLVFLLLTGFASLIFPKLVGDLVDGSSSSPDKIDQIENIYNLSFGNGSISNIILLQISKKNYFVIFNSLNI